jgi:hypothetical protein
LCSQQLEWRCLRSVAGPKRVDWRRIEWVMRGDTAVSEVSFVRDVGGDCVGWSAYRSEVWMNSR